MTTPALDVIDDPMEQRLFTRWDTPAQGARMAESALRIGGMYCAACAGTLEQALLAVPGVTRAQVSAASHCATVRYSVPALASHLVKAVEAAGYQAVPDTAAAARGMRQKESRTALWRLFVAVFCAMQIMMLATPVYVSAPGELAPDLKRLLEWAEWLLCLPVLWFSSAPFLVSAWRAVRQHRINMDVPVALGIATTFIASSGAAFDPGAWFGSEVFFDSLAMFVSFLLGGRYLEMRARHHAEAALEDATARLPDTVLRLLPDGTVEQISALRLRLGDSVRVPVGQGFAADGVLTRGSTQADEALLTGESRPVPKRVGDEVAAGSINLGAPVEMRVQRVGGDTRFEAIVALMRGARTQRPALLAAADQWATPFLWTVLLLAATAGAVWSVIDPSRAVWVVVSVLIVTCPCALSLAAPSAMLAAASAMGSMGGGGLLLRRLDAIQNLARMRVLFVDKTGTLTQNGLDCTAELAGSKELDVSLINLQGTAASLAAWSTHPVSVAVSGAFDASPTAWRNVRELPGAGLEGTDEQGHKWRLGSAAWATAAISTQGLGSSYLSRNGETLLNFHLTEHLRDDASEAVRALQAAGVRVQLLSGDDPNRARRVAAALGLVSADVSAGLTPDAKLAAVRDAQQHGNIVGMVGDGINDAPVLALADVSIAMGEGALVARAQADAVLISNRLLDLVRARALAQRTLRVIRQNLVWAALYNAACVPLALLGLLPPWAAGLGMASSSLLVVLNSMRLSRGLAGEAVGSKHKPFALSLSKGSRGLRQAQSEREYFL
jgi:P-type Cu2+ transporter